MATGGKIGKMSVFLWTNALIDRCLPIDSRGGEVKCLFLPDGMNPYQAEIEEFCCAILEGDTPYNSAELGLRSQCLLEACQRSVREGITVELPFSETLLSFVGLLCCF